MATEEEQLKQLQEELSELESQDGIDLSKYGSPEPEKKDNMFKFFREILHLPKSWKVGNLKEEEIGKSKLSIKSYLELSTYAKAEGLDVVSEYFTSKADIVASVSMGRKGFMPQLFVTQIKKEQKVKEPELKNKGLFFGGNKNEE